ncbi:MAG: light-harvesting antenna LH1, beta subunit [Pseudomonadota bacterium]
MSDRNTLTGLTAEEAQEFHRLFQASFVFFTAVAVTAHFLVWLWRPWFPPVEGYQSSAVDNVSEIHAIVETQRDLLA